MVTERLVSERSVRERSVRERSVRTSEVRTAQQQKGTHAETVRGVCTDSVLETLYWRETLSGVSMVFNESHRRTSEF